MCKRNTDDPLVRMFLDRYRINLLAVPREGPPCGEIYVRQGRSVSDGAGLAGLLTPAVTLPAVVEGQELTKLDGKLSNGVKVGAGLGLLQGFLTAIGAAAVLSKLSTRFESSKTAELSFSFGGVTRDSMNVNSLAGALAGRRLVESNPLVQPGNEYYVAAGVVRSTAISVVAQDAAKRHVELGAEAAQVLNADVGVTLEEGGNGELTFRGSTPLAIGLQLYKLHFDESGALRMTAQDPRDPVHAGREPRPEPVLVAPDEETLLALG